jgi:hypothetical protein
MVDLVWFWSLRNLPDFDHLRTSKYLLPSSPQAVVAIVFLIATLSYLIPKADRDLFNWNGAGTCTLSPTPPALSTFSGCALAGGAIQGSNGALSGLAKSQSKFTAAHCNYTGEACAVHLESSALIVLGRFFLLLDDMKAVCCAPRNALAGSTRSAFPPFE